MAFWGSTTKLLHIVACLDLSLSLNLLWPQGAILIATSRLCQKTPRSYSMVLQWSQYFLCCWLNRLFQTGGKALLAFGVGAVGTILGTVAAWCLVSHMLGSEGWKIAAVLCATYIGGSINMISTADVVGLTSSSLLAAVFAADNVAMALYLGSISLIPARKGAAAIWELGISTWTEYRLRTSMWYSSHNWEVFPFPSCLPSLAHLRKLLGVDCFQHLSTLE